MKKVFLIFSIVAFSSASAQRKELFDIQKHIEKKQLDGKKAAQKNKFSLPAFKKFQFTRPIKTSPSLLSYSLPNGDVVIYGNGTMPCIKPGLSQFQNMPNLSSKGQFNFNFSPHKAQPGQIPNASAKNWLVAVK